MTTLAKTPRSARIAWHAAADEREWVEQGANAIATALADALTRSSAVCVLVSGGSTPAPVYRALAERELDWPRVTVGLVDDRDVEPDTEGSNARLARETLLQGNAAQAKLELLRGTNQSIDEAVEHANARWHRIARSSAFATAVLGMGDDGHTASLFPGAANLDAALATDEPYAAIDASGCRVAGAFPRRITLTPAGLAEARHRILLLRGEGKREVFERALEPGNARELPIRAAIDLEGAPLHVYWCP